MEKASITLTKAHHDLAMKAVQSGEYASLSEVIRDALREWTHGRETRALEREALRQDIAAGLRDAGEGRVSDFDPADIKKRGKDRLAANGKS